MSGAFADPAAGAGSAWTPCVQLHKIEAWAQPARIRSRGISLEY
jgi:hypothetical protein